MDGVDEVTCIMGEESWHQRKRASHIFSAGTTLTSGMLCIVNALSRASEMDGVDVKVIITSEHKTIK